MKKIFIYFIKIFILFFIFTSLTNAWVNPKIESIYISFIEKLETNYSSSKELSILKSLDKQIDSLLESPKLSLSNKELISDLSTLNKEKIWFLDELLWWVDLSRQKLIEKVILDKAKKEIEDLTVASYIKDIISDDIKFAYIDDKNEFLDWDIFKKLYFTEYYNIDSSNAYLFKWKKWYVFLIKSTWKYWFVENYSIENKIAYSDSINLFKWFYSYNKPYFEENDVYYMYQFLSFRYISDSYGFFLKDLEWNWFNSESLVLYFDENWRFNFVSRYEKVKLISANILAWATNKSYFLKEIANDKKFLTNDTDDDFIELKNFTKSLNKWLSKQEAIKNIYWWLIENIDYTKNIDLKDYKIFSWIETFKNRDWVCDWYVKLMTYMLLFLWYDDIEAIRWYVIDAQDFPEIWHAWIRIWDKYYDPTFDDPIWAINIRKYEDYLYFWLPRDLFYTNRYDKDELPDYIKDDSLEVRESIIFNNLYKIASKYSDSDYNILKPFKFRIENGFDSKVLWVEDFSKVIRSYYVDNFYFSDGIKNYHISKFKYFVVNDSNIENTIKYNFNYNLDWLYLFKWKLDDWNYEYRLWYNVELN